MIRKTSHHRIVMAILAFAVMLPVFCPTIAKANDTHTDEVLLLEKPAANWEKEAFPLGNGRLGCMVFGGLEEERIQFNVDSLWTGDENLPGNYEAPGMGSYQNFGDLYVALDARGPAKNYRRELNIARAVCRVAYEQDGTEFVRETFCSHPDQVAVSRMTASAKGKYSGRIRLAGGHGEKTATGIRDDGEGKRLVTWFTPDPDSKQPRSGTVQINGGNVKASLNKRRSMVNIHTAANAEDLDNGFWETTIHGKEKDGKFVLDSAEIYPLVDPRTVDDPELPRVLVVGDSISMNYHNAAKAALKGKANYYRVEGNGGPSDHGVSNMELWLGDYTKKGLQWDVIQFNHGLHDLKQPYDKTKDSWGDYQVSIEDYKKNLEKEIQIMQQTGATLIWCSTTPVPNSSGGIYARRKGEAEVFNKAAMEVISKYPEIQINDLHKFISESKAFDKWRKGTDVHFWDVDLQGLVGKAVADAITKALPFVPIEILREDFLDWKYGMFIHFNVATYNEREWASGYEDPASFAGDKLDCNQWADAAGAAGMKYAVLTVKHTGGWCLWDSEHTSSHDITAFKNYKNGKGDIVREFVDAFRKRRIKVGLYYCFPGNFARGGNLPKDKEDLHGLPPEAKGDYTGFIKKQLSELLTRYGPIDLLWADQYSNSYTRDDWQEIKRHIKSLQPNCIVIANNSLDFRDTDIQSYEYPWLKVKRPAKALPPEDNDHPAEVCDKIGPGWFWSTRENNANLKTAEEVAAMVKLCNSRRANYLLNVAPDRSGLIPAYSVERLRQAGKLLRAKTRTGSFNAKEYHVSTTGFDGSPGTKSKPFKTISKAAEAARPGDMITVHEGVYRERVNPPRGGVSDDKRIVYRAADGEKVTIKGSEVVKGWNKAAGDTWIVTLPNSSFGNFNPFDDLISGDWFHRKGRDHHTGSVYLNGHWLTEASKLEEAMKPVGKSPLWFAQVDDTNTTVWAQFEGVNPNKQEVEVNVRRTVFYPEKPGMNYITVRGFIMQHAATPWAPPTAEQIGLIGTHWSKGWIIEDNEVSYSICSGITLGKYGDEFDNTSQNSAEGYVETINRALKHGWSKENIGSHTVRNNHVHDCEQAGIVGSMGAAFSTITGNDIQDASSLRHAQQCIQSVERHGFDAGEHGEVVGAPANDGTLAYSAAGQLTGDAQQGLRVPLAGMLGPFRFGQAEYPAAVKQEIGFFRAVAPEVKLPSAVAMQLATTHSSNWQPA